MANGKRAGGIASLITAASMAAAGANAQSPSNEYSPLEQEAQRATTDFMAALEEQPTLFYDPATRKISVNATAGADGFYFEMPAEFVNGKVVPKPSGVTAIHI